MPRCRSSRDQIVSLHGWLSMEEFTDLITSLDGHTPVLTVNNANFTVTLASQNGRDYFYVITCAGTPGSTAAVSVDGKYLLTATVGGSASALCRTRRTRSPWRRAARISSA